ncbi:MAG: hypothetical protein HKP37_10840 [Boseongicola sp.]|nr:hypothetical protein [Boseongicola sp.]
MFLRALLILLVVGSVSISLTMYFGTDVLVALGLILVQLKVLAKKLVSVELPSILAWLKTETATFFRIELLKKWAMTSALPLLVGNALLRKIDAFLSRYHDAIRRQYDALLTWYNALEWYEKIVMTLIMVFAALGLSVSSIGLWLILFSVKLPFWLVAAFSSFVQMTWVTIRKMAFKTVAFLQLGWLWRIVQRRLPEGYLERKRRIDFRVARMVVRKRRLTVRQLAERKDSLSLRWAVIRAGWKKQEDED